MRDSERQFHHWQASRDALKGLSDEDLRDMTRLLFTLRKMKGNIEIAKIRIRGVSTERIKKFVKRLRMMGELFDPHASWPRNKEEGKIVQVT